MSKAEKKLHDVWEASPNKLLIFIKEGVGVFAGEFVKLVLSIGKQKVKTTALEGNDPIFNQYFMFNIPDPKEDLRIALYTVKKKVELTPSFPDSPC